MAHVAMQQNDESGSPVTSGEHVTTRSTQQRRHPDNETPLLFRAN